MNQWDDETKKVIDKHTPFRLDVPTISKITTVKDMKDSVDKWIKLLGLWRSTL